MKFIKANLKKIASTSYESMLLNGADFSDYYKDGFYPGLPYHMGGSKPNIAQEKPICLAAIFKSEYGFNIQRYGLQKAAREYLLGLPSVLSYPFNNHDIINWMQTALDATIPEKYHCDAVDEYWRSLGGAFTVITGKHINRV